MRRRKIITLLVLGVSIGAIFLVAKGLSRSPAQALYRGKTVTEWLNTMRYASREGFQPGEPDTDPALVAIKSIGAPAVPVCLWHLTHAREASSLNRLWDKVLISIQRTNRPPDPKVAQWTCAAAALAYLGPERGGGVSKVIEGVLARPVASSAAANAFFVVGTNEPSTLSALIKGLRDSRPAVREFCAESIARMSPWAQTALPILTNLVQDSDPIVRNYAIGTIGTIGKGNPEVVRLVRDTMASSTNWQLSAALAGALKELGDNPSP